MFRLWEPDNNDNYISLKMTPHVIVYLSQEN